MGASGHEAFGGFQDAKPSESAATIESFNAIRQVSPQRISLDGTTPESWQSRITVMDAIHRLSTTRPDSSTPSSRIRVRGLSVKPKIDHSPPGAAPVHDRIPYLRPQRGVRSDIWSLSEQQTIRPRGRNGKHNMSRMARRCEILSGSPPVRRDKRFGCSILVHCIQKRSEAGQDAISPRKRRYVVLTADRQTCCRTHSGYCEQERHDPNQMGCSERSPKRRRKRHASCRYRTPVLEAQPAPYVFDFFDMLSIAHCFEHDETYSPCFAPNVSLSRIDNLHSGVAQTDSSPRGHDGTLRLDKLDNRNITDLVGVGQGYSGRQVGGGPGVPEGRSANELPLSSGNRVGNKRRRSPDGEDREDDDLDDEDKNKDGNDPSRKRLKLDDHGDSRKFACPFFKNDPRKYASVRSCLGPGWPSAHRVKEHVLRRHTILYHCKRCWSDQKKKELLLQHEQTGNCTSRDKPEGIISQQQEDSLRRRGKKAMSDEERWKEMFRIVFPEAQEIPSPYYDPEEVKPSPEVQEDAQMDQVEQVIDGVQTELRDEIARMVGADQAPHILTSVGRAVQRVWGRIFRPQRRATDPQESRRGSWQNPLRRRTEPSPSAREPSPGANSQQLVSPISLNLELQPDQQFDASTSLDMYVDYEHDPVYGLPEEPQSSLVPQPSGTNGLGDLSVVDDPAEYGIPSVSDEIQPPGECLAEDQKTIVPPADQAAADRDSSESTTAGHTPPSDSSTQSTSQQDGVEPEDNYLTEEQLLSRQERDLACIGLPLLEQTQEYSRNRMAINEPGQDNSRVPVLDPTTHAVITTLRGELATGPESLSGNHHAEQYTSQ
ncbi:hypothetical protein QBC47DRAFT_100192 [Echria macrotheca]|uniref:C2H2-type domain-containing protein n=1 Tax=Echria macrotheca TaxID=438768 RepID=A0AAJ0BL57_9PEZI|nr:hypothetical protein QBC47DRAFT_100192 [Echria macrotheca]